MNEFELYNYYYGDSAFDSPEIDSIDYESEEESKSDELTYLTHDD
jgi:hypothetical protein